MAISLTVGWLPIDTAPRDGQEIVAWDVELVIVAWEPLGSMVGWQDGEGRLRDVTRWHPLAEYSPHSVDWRVLDQAWKQVTSGYLPIRREGESVPGADTNGQFSFQWWRGPSVWYRAGDKRVRIGCHMYAGHGGHVGPYAIEDTVL